MQPHEIAPLRFPVSCLFCVCPEQQRRIMLQIAASGCILVDMAQKDIAEKTLMAYNDVFADVMNVLMGKHGLHVREDELTDAQPLSQYKADDSRLHEQERDVAKFWKKGNVRICLCGLENQTAIDVDIPLRVISYDGAAYRAQLLADKPAASEKNAADADGSAAKHSRKMSRYPVITLVLYFGMERWNKPRSLLECIDVPDELKPYVSNYKVNVFEIAWLEPETVARFKSDFRIVADYFVQMRKNRDYKPSAEVIKHVHETLQLMSVLTGDNRFEEAQEPIGTSVTGGKTMCEVLTKIENRGIAIGESRGIAIGESRGIAIGESRGIVIGEKRGFDNGIQQNRIATAKIGFSMGLSLQQIEQLTSLSEQELLALKESM